MDPSQVRERILSEQDRLLDLLDDAERVAVQVRNDPEAYPVLHRIAEDLESELSEFFDIQEEILEPALRETDAWGDIRAERLAEYLRGQRMAVYAACRQVEAGELPPWRAADELEELVHVVRVGLVRAERHFLREDLLRDDLVTIRQTGG
ncbi:MAG TPA: hypothetical protein VN033_04680 [Vulgatibacter sp.]|nr:hypothetical protein [Vulgatibacter sp.]